MQYFSADCLILRATDRGDHDKLLTLLSAEHGKLYAILKGARSMHRRQVAATEPYTWSQVELYERGGVKWVKTATANESFPALRYDMDKLFMAAYFCDVAAELSDEGQPADAILSLTLNALHMLSVTQGENARIKGAFEMRAACIGGFTPSLQTCKKCHHPITGDSFLDIMNGAPICKECHTRAEGLVPLQANEDLRERRVICQLSPGSAAALSYVTTAPPKRVFAFRITNARELDEFSHAAEQYLLHHLERSFPTLETLKKLDGLSKQCNRGCSNT